MNNSKSEEYYLKKYNKYKHKYTETQQNFSKHQLKGGTMFSFDIMTISEETDDEKKYENLISLIDNTKDLTCDIILKEYEKIKSIISTYFKTKMVSHLPIYRSDNYIKFTINYNNITERGNCNPSKSLHLVLEPASSNKVPIDKRVSNIQYSTASSLSELLISIKECTDEEKYNQLILYIGNNKIESGEIEETFTDIKEIIRKYFTTNVVTYRPEYVSTNYIEFEEKYDILRSKNIPNTVINLVSKQDSRKQDNSNQFTNNLYPRKPDARKPDDRVLDLRVGVPNQTTF